MEENKEEKPVRKVTRVGLKNSDGSPEAGSAKAGNRKLGSVGSGGTRPISGRGKDK